MRTKTVCYKDYTVTMQNLWRLLKATKPSIMTGETKGTEIVQYLWQRNVDKLKKYRA